MDAIGISNLAIDLVGGSSIMSFEDDTLEAEACKRSYDTARTFCLESREWTFASETRRLAAAVSEDYSEFSTIFPLPADCLKVRIVSRSSDLRSLVNYTKNGKNLLADETTLYIKYTKNITDTSLFSPAFQIAVAHKLAELISGTITGDKTLKRTLNAETEMALENGGAIDGSQGTPRRTRASILVNARYRYGRRRYGLGSYLD